jgi:hypothetical protein
MVEGFVRAPIERQKAPDSRSGATRFERFLARSARRAAA